MLVFLSLATERRKILFFTGLIIFFSIICFIIGFWAGNEVIAEHSFEPELCSVYERQGQKIKPWYFPPERSDDFIGCNESMKNLETSHSELPAEDYYVSFSYLFSLDNKTRVEADWIQSLRAFVVFDSKFEAFGPSELSFEAQLLVNVGSFSKEKWEILASTKETRKLHCSSRISIINGYAYGCTTLPIFELSSINYDKYRLNIRFLGTGNITYISEMKHLSDMHLVLRHNNVRYTEVMGHMKAVFFPLMVLVHLQFRDEYFPLDTQMEWFLYLHTGFAMWKNFPFEYFWKWFGSMVYIHFTSLADVAFLASTLIVWLFFLDFLTNPYSGKVRITSKDMFSVGDDIKFMITEGRPDTKLRKFTPYLIVLFLFFVLIGMGEYYRWVVHYEPFFSPWRSCILTFKELDVFDFIYSTLLLSIGIFITFQFYRKMSASLLNTNAILYQSGQSKWFDFNIPNAMRFCLCVFCCVCTCVVELTANLLLNVHWKFRRTSNIMDFLLAPSFFTFYLGMVNILTIVFLCVMPKLYLRSGEKIRFRFFGSRDLMKDHVAYCCLHSLLGARGCQSLLKKDDEGTTKMDHCGRCCVKNWSVLNFDVGKNKTRMNIQSDLVVTCKEKNELIKETSNLHFLECKEPIATEETLEENHKHYDLSMKKVQSRLWQAKQRLEVFDNICDHIKRRLLYKINEFY